MSYMSIMPIYIYIYIYNMYRRLRVQLGNRFVSCNACECTCGRFGGPADNWLKSSESSCLFGPGILSLVPLPNDSCFCSLVRSRFPSPLHEWNQGDPSESNYWDHVIPNKKPNGLECVRLWLISFEWVRVRSSESKWDQVNPNKSKWIQMRSSETVAAPTVHFGSAIPPWNVLC